MTHLCSLSVLDTVCVAVYCSVEAMSPIKVFSSPWQRLCGSDQGVSRSMAPPTPTMSFELSLPHLSYIPN